MIVPSRARRLGQPDPAEGGDEMWRGFDGCLGDVTDLEMMVVSSLPARFDVGDLAVVLSIMQVGQLLTQDLLLYGDTEGLNVSSVCSTSSFLCTYYRVGIVRACLLSVVIAQSATQALLLGEIRVKS